MIDIERPASRFITDTVINLFSLFIVLTIFFSCMSENRNDREMVKLLKDNIGKEVAFKDTIYGLRSESDSIVLTKNTLGEYYKILTFIHGDCDPCINDIPEWSVFIEQLPEDVNILGLVFILNTLPGQFLSHNEGTSLSSKLLFIFDMDYWMHNHNEIPFNNLLSTFFLDKSNIITLMGNPLKNDQVKQLYIRVVHEIHVEK